MQTVSTFVHTGINGTSLHEMFKVKTTIFMFPVTEENELFRRKLDHSDYIMILVQMSQNVSVFCQISQ